MMARWLLFIGFLLVFPALLWLGSAGGLAPTTPVADAVNWLEEPTPTPVDPLIDPAEGEGLPLWILLCAFGGILLLASVSWPVILTRLRDSRSDHQRDSRL